MQKQPMQLYNCARPAQEIRRAYTIHNTFSGSLAYSWAWRLPALTLSAALSMPSCTFSEVPLTLGRCDPARFSVDCTASLRPAHVHQLEVSGVTGKL